MTTRANPLIHRATMPAMSVPSGYLRTFVDALVRLGFDREPLLTASKVEASTLADPDAHVPNSAVGDVLCAAEAQKRMPNMGLRIAGEVPIGAFALLDYLIVTSENVGDGFRALRRYLSLTGSPATVTIEDGDDPVHVIIESNPFTVEFTVALAVRHMRGETQGRFSPEFISFRHVPANAAEFEERLGCRVLTNAKWNGFAVARPVWCEPLRRRDPILRHMLQHQADQLREAAPRDQDVTGEVRRAITARLGGDVSIQRIAADLNTAPRTLQRRLGAAGQSYDALRHAVLREIAERCLAAADLSIGEIACLLGYSEPAAFHRAFKRWTGSTPQAFRASSRT
jgi:AraC-like DNA-binding protein